MRNTKSILILGGTAESRELAARLLTLGYNVTTSLAGVTAAPILPEGKLRVGGFGGVEGLKNYLEAEGIDLLIDATHPFAMEISRNAHEAAQAADLQLVRIERLPWALAAGDHWIGIWSMREAAAYLPAGSHVFVTTGHKGLDELLALKGVTGVIRTVEPVSQRLPAGWQIRIDRPPHSLKEELALFSRHRFTHLLTKNSGGSATYAKIQAANILKLPVVIISRSMKPECATFETVDALIAALGRGLLAG